MQPDMETMLNLVPVDKEVIVFGPSDPPRKGRIIGSVKEIDPKGKWIKTVFASRGTADCISGNVGLVLFLANSPRETMALARERARSFGITFVERALTGSQMLDTLEYLAKRKKSRENQPIEMNGNGCPTPTGAVPNSGSVDGRDPVSAINGHDTVSNGTAKEVNSSPNGACPGGALGVSDMLKNPDAFFMPRFGVVEEMVLAMSEFAKEYGRVIKENEFLRQGSTRERELQDRCSEQQEAIQSLQKQVVFLKAQVEKSEREKIEYAGKLKEAAKVLSGLLPGK